MDSEEDLVKWIQVLLDSCDPTTVLHGPHILLSVLKDPGWSRSSGVNVACVNLDFLDCFLSPVHEAAVLEVITVTSDLQLPAGEAFPFVEGDLEK